MLRTGVCTGTARQVFTDGNVLRSHDLRKIRNALQGTIFFTLIAFCLVALPCASAEMRAPQDALIRLNTPPGWSVGVRYQVDRRAFVSEGTPLDFDFTHAVAQMGYSALPYLHCQVEAGSSKAELVEGGEEGERGFEWSARATINLLEHVIEDSPVVGKKQVASFAVEGRITSSESNFGDSDFSWYELAVTPTISYVINRLGDPIWHPYEPTGLAVRGGLTFASVDGDYGAADIEADRDFGVLIGTDIRSNSGWLFSLEGTFYGSNDHTFGLGLGYYF